MTNRKCKNSYPKRRSRYLLIYSSAFAMILSFQNCGKNSFHTRMPSNKISATASIPSEGFGDVEDGDSVLNIPIDDIGVGANAQNSATNLASSNNTNGKSYYLSPSGDDSNPGTLSKPWKTLDRLQKAQSIIKPGDTIYFRSGDYTVNDSAKTKLYDFATKGTPSARIIYKNYQNESPVLIYDRRTFGPDIGRTILYPGEYTTYEGLTFRQTEASRKIAFEKASAPVPERIAWYRSHRVIGMQVRDNVILRNCTIDNFSGLGIASKNNVLVEFNTFTNNGGHVFYLQGANGIFRNNLLDGSRQSPDGHRGIQIQYLRTHHNQIYRNLIKNVSAAGVTFSGQVSYNSVYNNVFINAGDKRISGHVVGGNMEDGPVGAGNRFYNNTSIGKTKYEIFGGTAVSQLAKIEIYDNIFYPSSPIPFDKSGGGISKTFSKIKNNIFYNILGVPASGNRNGVNPMLVNAMGTTWASAMLKSGSPAINTGKPDPNHLPTNDFNHRTRPQSGMYDIGAFEW